MNDLSEDEWENWYRLTPQERWRESQKLWDFYVQVGGSLDPEPDSQSPFDADFPAHAQPSVRILRRSGVYLAIIDQPEEPETDESP